MSKKCSGCNAVKKLVEYYKEKNGAQGVKGKCIICYDGIRLKYRLLNKQKISQMNKNYYKSPKGHKKMTEYREKTRDIYKEKRNDPVNQAKIKAYRKNHPRKITDTRREYMKNYRKAQYKDNQQFRLGQVLRVRIRDALKDIHKTASSMELIGCNIDHLRKHLQSLFKTGMNWGNYGAWHIDHKLPCRMFNLSLESEQRKCFHWTNLQPLWAHENLRKGGTFDVEEDTLTSIYLLFE